MSRDKTMIEQVKADLVGTGVGHFHTGINCRYDRYDLYFGAENKEVRRSALTAFTMMLGTWHAQSAFSFTPQHLRKFDGAFGNEDWKHYELQHYVKAFVTHYVELRKDFPIMTAFIIWFFIHIEDDLSLIYEESFPELDPAWCARFRTEVLLPNSAVEMPEMRDFFIETKLEPFFLSDLPDREET